LSPFDLKPPLYKFVYCSTHLQFEVYWVFQLKIFLLTASNTSITFI